MFGFLGELEFYLFQIIFKICLRIHRFPVMMNLKTNKRKHEKKPLKETIKHRRRISTYLTTDNSISNRKIHSTDLVRMESGNFP